MSTDAAATNAGQEIEGTGNATSTETVRTGGSDRIAIQREWVGAPSGTLANPTFWLSVVTLIVFVGTSGLYLVAALPAVATSALNAVAIYLGFTVMHDAMHGVAHENRRANAWLGRLTAALLLIPMPLFRAVHYEHHSHTNDPERDPDIYFPGAPMWLVPLWATMITLQYRRHYYGRHYYGRRLWRSRSELAETLFGEIAGVAIFVAALATGSLTSVLVIWFAPALLALIFLATTFDYLPHYPYDSRERYHDTRIYPGRVGFVILLGQNYHLIHHLWTTIPWYRYPRVFDSIRPELEQRGSRIGWRIE